MQLCGVALVLCQLILRILLVQLQHIAVTTDLGQHRGCADAGTGGIALDHRLCRDLQACGGTVAIHQHQIGHDVQLFHRLLHPAHGGVQDVFPVDDLRPHKDDAVGQRFFADLVKQRLALFFGQLFGIVDAVHRVFRVQNTGRYAHRAAQRAASGFVHACRNEGGVLRVEIRQQLHFRRAVNLRHRNFPPAACSRHPSSRREWSAKPS